jgi:hypothetical protein
LTDRQTAETKISAVVCFERRGLAVRMDQLGEQNHARKIKLIRGEIVHESKVVQYIVLVRIFRAPQFSEVMQPKFIVMLTSKVQGAGEFRRPVFIDRDDET